MRAEYKRLAYPKTIRKAFQEGFFLIEALVAILIFALGILGLVAMGGTAVTTQSDAQYRTEAVSLADQIAGEIAVGVDRTSTTTLASTLANYAHQSSGSNCAWSGATTAPGTPVSETLARAAAMPGATATMQQITVTPAYNRVQITLCWKGPADTAARKHTLVTYVN